jgi:predicted site-specific integrase-resolvase
MLTRGEAAAFCGVSIRTIQSWARRYGLPARRGLNGRWIVPEDELRRWYERTFATGAVGCRPHLVASA